MARTARLLRPNSPQHASTLRSSAKCLLSVSLLVVLVLEALTQGGLVRREAFVGACRGSLLRQCSTDTSPRRVALRAEDSEGEADAEGEVSVEEPVKPMKPKRKIKVIKIKKFFGIDLDGDDLTDEMLEQFYQEGLEVRSDAGKGDGSWRSEPGRGGMPRGFVKDLMLRSFFGKFSKKGGYFFRSVMYNGPDGQPSAQDYEVAWEVMKNRALGIHPGQKKGWYGNDDKRGWTWLVGAQNPGGLFLYYMRSPPYGERPLALIKNSNPEEFFEKVNWKRVFTRLHKENLWGGPLVNFPYPVGFEECDKPWRPDLPQGGNGCTLGWDSQSQR